MTHGYPAGLMAVILLSLLCSPGALARDADPPEVPAGEAGSPEVSRDGPGGPASDSQEAEIPLVGLAPVGDMLPPLDPEQRDRAAMHMMLVMVIALAVIILLLSVLAKRQRRLQEEPSPTEEFVERVTGALEAQDADQDSRADQDGEKRE